MAGSSGIVGAISAIAGKFDASKHKRGAGGKFAFQGGSKPKPTSGKGSGSVAAAHALFDKMKGKPKADILAAAQAMGLNPNTAKTQLYHWQKKQATEALAGVKNPTKEQMQQAVAHAIGVKGVEAPKPTPKPAPKVETKPAGHYTGKDGKLYYVNAAGQVYHTHPMTGQVTGAAHDPAPVDKAHGQVGLNKALQAHDAHVNPPSPVTAKAKEAPSLEKLGPTKYVHALADHMQGASAKDVKAAAVKAGVNPSTASVQYSKWKNKQAGIEPQLQKSPEPKPLQAKQPADMSDKELDKAIDSYHGKLNVVPESESFAAKPYKHAEDYHDHQGGKALTAKLKSGDVYTNAAQGKTFYKSNSGRIYEHTGGMGPMKLVAGDPSAAEFHYDPAAKIVYAKSGGVLKPISTTTPVFKNNQPYEPGDHVFKDHSWAGLNGVQDPNNPKAQAYENLLAVHKAAGVDYNESSYAIKSYTGSGYHAINGELRASKGKTVGAKAQEIDKLISKSSFKTDTIMWRGVGSGGGEWNGAPPPSEVVDHGFTSVSFKPDVAKGFSNGKTIFRVKVPAGFPGLNVAIGSPGSGAAGLHSEAEVMLPRGTTYKAVQRHAKAAGQYDVVDLEPVLPQWYIEKYGQPKLG